MPKSNSIASALANLDLTRHEGVEAHADRMFPAGDVVGSVGLAEGEDGFGVLDALPLSAVVTLSPSLVMATWVAPDLRAFWRVSFRMSLMVALKNAGTLSRASGWMVARMVRGN